MPLVRGDEELTNLALQSFDFLNEDGILLSLELINRVLELTSQENNQGFASRILVKVRDNYDENVVRTNIYEILNEYNVEIITTAQWVDNDRALFTNIKYILSIMLFIFIFTAVGNLSISTYAFIIERRTEIRSLRGIGLAVHDVEKLFFYELLILLLSNGFMGFIIGVVMALTFSSLGEILYRVKAPFTIAYDLSLLLFALAIVYLKISYSRIFRQKIEMKI